MFSDGGAPRLAHRAGCVVPQRHGTHEAGRKVYPLGSRPVNRARPGLFGRHRSAECSGERASVGALVGAQRAAMGRACIP